MINPNGALEGYGEISSKTESYDGSLVETVVGPNGEILAIIAGRRVFLHSMEVSSIISTRAEEYPISFVRHVRSRLKFYMDNLNITRMQAWARADKPFILKYNKLLGFEVEGLMRKFDPAGVDCYLLSIVR